MNSCGRLGLVFVLLVACSHDPSSPGAFSDAMVTGQADAVPRSRRARDPIAVDVLNATDAGASAEGADTGPALDASGEESCLDPDACGDARTPPEVCESLALGADVRIVTQLGNVLFLFDRSASMAEMWSGQVRWEVAGTAVQGAVSPLADELNAGVLFFPSADPNAPIMCIDPTGIVCIFEPSLVVPSGTCAVNPIDADDQIGFVPGDEFLTAFAGVAGAAPPYAPIPNSMTPLAEVLALARDTLASAALSDPVTVVIVTDGDPNCGWDAAAALQVVSDWHAAGIDTHVLGLPAPGGAPAMDALNALASAGGTQPSMAPDGTALEQGLNAILRALPRTSLESCTIALDAPVGSADPLHLIVTQTGVRYDVPRDLGGGAGWALAVDGATVELSGELCAAAQQGRLQDLAFEVGCVELSTWPPP